MLLWTRGVGHGGVGAALSAFMDDPIQLFESFLHDDLGDLQKCQGPLNLRIKSRENRDLIGHGAVAQALALLVPVGTKRRPVEQEYVFRAHPGALQPQFAGFSRLERARANHQAPDGHCLAAGEPVLDDGVAGELWLFTAHLFGHGHAEAD